MMCCSMQLLLDKSLDSLHFTDGVEQAHKGIYYVFIGLEIM